MLTSSNLTKGIAASFYIPFRVINTDVHNESTPSRINETNETLNNVLLFFPMPVSTSLINRKHVSVLLCCNVIVMRT